MATDRDRPPPNRLHGRVAGERPCSASGCRELGEFRVPGERRPGFDGPGTWRWMCLDHVREFNARYNYFAGMSVDEILEAQSPLGGWERETRAFSTTGADAPPRWADFKDPMEALSARYRRFREPQADTHPSAPGERYNQADSAALKTLGLPPGTDRKAIRAAYAKLLRLYHPDRNGGDRRHEKALQAVIAAYTHLSKSASPTG